MTIATLADLVDEVREEMDDSGYPLDKIYRAIGRAEAMFNRELRVPQMETPYTVTGSTEAILLPADFLALRSVYVEGSPDGPLRSMSPAGLRNLYLGRSGIPQAYSLEGQRLVFAPVGSTTITMLYYAKIAPLTEAVTTNWLITDYPDIYLHQVLAILFQRTGDRERAADNLGLATAMIAQVNKAGRKARYGAAPLAPALVQQTTGVRI